MTVHMFRVCASEGGSTLEELQTAIDDWVAEHTKWADDPVEPTVRAVDGVPDDESTTYHSADIRFEKTDTKDNIVQKLEDKVVNKVDWYRVGYHNCDHDEANRGGCSWDDVVEWTAKDVTIPDYVPTFV